MVARKGTTTGHWKEVSREAQKHTRFFGKARGSAVPAFLGTINLALINFHDAGDVSQMPVMGWGGESLSDLTTSPGDSPVEKGDSRAECDSR